MDVAQMMAHCSITMDIASGRLNLPRILIGRDRSLHQVHLPERKTLQRRTDPREKSLWSPTGAISRGSAAS